MEMYYTRDRITCLMDVNNRILHIAIYYHLPLFLCHYRVLDLLGGKRRNSHRILWQSIALFLPYLQPPCICLQNLHAKRGDCLAGWQLSGLQ